MAHNSTFIQIDTIKGDSTDNKHKDWIEINGFSQNMAQSRAGSSSAQGGLIDGKVEISDLHLSKRMDLSSPALALACCEGRHITKMVLENCRQIKSQTETVLKYTLSDLVISSFHSAGGGAEGTVPAEDVTIRYSKIEWEYTPIDDKGNKGAAIKGGWDLRKNQKV